MLQKLKRIFQGDPPPIAEKIEHPILGTLTWSWEHEAWLSNPDHAGLGFVFDISGDLEPDKTLLAHAAEILRNKDSFTTTVMAYLQEQAKTVHSLRAFRDEIAKLQIESVSVHQPDRPSDAMIYFGGGQPDRMWRCSSIEGKLQGFGFDS